MYERLTHCPLCNRAQFLNQLIVKDHANTQESFTICRCTHCDLWFTNPRPTVEAIEKYYNHQDYISHSNRSNSLVNILYKLVRKITLRQKLKWISERHKTPARLLDYGSGAGYFLAAAKNQGWNVSGVEPNQLARVTTESQHNIVVNTHIDELNKEKKYDVITLFHVLEHVHDLKNTLQHLLKLLKRRGTLYIAVPNREAPDSNYYKEDWAAFDIPRHLYHFNKKSIEFLADKYGLKIIDAKPMLFDTYYISILSDKYAQRTSSIFSSLTKGYKFNSLASEQNNNYSSILFIMKKK